MQDLHSAVSQVIEAAGFNAMAREYLTVSEYRQRIVTAMGRNIARDRNFGKDKAREFVALAAKANGWRVWQ
jgi:hypothetical protein